MAERFTWSVGGFLAGYGALSILVMQAIPQSSPIWGEVQAIIAGVVLLAIGAVNQVILDDE